MGSVGVGEITQSHFSQRLRLAVAEPTVIVPSEPMLKFISEPPLLPSCPVDDVAGRRYLGPAGSGLAAAVDKHAGMGKDVMAAGNICTVMTM